MLASTSITFDLSVFELFVPLAWGGTVILADNALAPCRDLPAARRGRRSINTVPSAHRRAAADGRPAALASPRSTWRGEALTRALADRVYERPETARLCNLYGPSEDTTYSTFAVIERAPDAAPSIGRPIAGPRPAIVDRRFGPPPVGVPGELCLGGDGLARGYLGRPELTAEKFVPDPWSGQPGARLYRTGDLVRRRPDGALDFLGRIDHQVKVRGFRIELGEIESGAPVRRRCRGRGRRRPRGRPRRPAARGLRGAHGRGGHRRRAPGGAGRPPPGVHGPLRLRLPGRPAAHPERQGGQKKLPAPESSRPELAEGFAAPRTALEIQVAEVWMEVLGVDRVGLRDSFWSLGGHSLLATRVFSRLYDALGVDLPLQTLFEAPTLGRFATAVGEKLVAEQGDDLLAELDGLSEEEIRALLEEES